MGYTQPPAEGEFGAYYGKYISRVPAGDVVATLGNQFEETLALLRSESARERAEYAYAPGKWTLKEVVGHIADTERVFAYRVLRIARADVTPLPGFDENAFTPAGEFGSRTLDSLVDELAAVRQATIQLLSNLPASAWTRLGTASNNPVSVRAIAWIIAGHEIHHQDGIRTNYLSEVAASAS